VYTFPCLDAINNFLLLRVLVIMHSFLSNITL